jgi:hypothetical protein
MKNFWILRAEEHEYLSAIERDIIQIICKLSDVVSTGRIDICQVKIRIEKIK